MRRYYTFVSILFLLIVLPIKVNAICDNNEKAELQKIAGNVTYGYEYLIDTDSFNITLTNLNPNIYIDNNGTIYKYSNSTELTLRGYKPGDSLRLYIYDTKYCSASALNILYINLPKKNKYYGTEICNGLEEFNLCQMWANNNLKEKEMQQKINEYKNPINQEENIEVSVENPLINMLINIYIKYYFIILPLIILLCISGMYKSYKKTKL